MIKALIENSKVEITDQMVVYDYIVLQWTEGIIIAEFVRRSIVDVSQETGNKGQSLLGDQRSEPRVMEKGISCVSFLEYLGNQNKKGKLADVREFTEDKNDRNQTNQNGY